MTAGVEWVTFGMEAAKPVYGTVRKIYKTKREKAHFRDLIAQACRRGGIDEQSASGVSERIVEAIDATAKQSRRRVKRISWALRINRGPSIDRLPTARLLEWLDGLYVQEIDKERLSTAPASISGLFWQVLGESFDPQGLPEDTAQYARRLWNTLERNDREHKSYIATAAVVLGGTASAGVAAGIADGATGAVDLDLKTALAALAGITLTALLATLTRALESRLSPRQAAAVTTVRQVMVAAGAHKAGDQPSPKVSARDEKAQDPHLEPKQRIGELEGVHPAAGA